MRSVAMVCLFAALGCADPVDLKIKGRVVLGSIADDSRLTSTKLSASANTRYEAMGNQLVLNGDIFYDGIYDLRPDRYSSAAAREYRWDVLVKEAYLRRGFGELEAYLGFQRISWDISDGIRILDVLSPYDYRDFLLESVESSRLPILALRLSRSVGSVSVEAIYSPFSSNDANPVFGSEFGPKLDAEIPVNYHRVPRYDWNLVNGRGGIRAQSTIGSVDAGICVVGGRSPTPFVATSMAFDSLGMPSLEASERLEQQILVGYHLTWAFDQFVLRHEAAAVPEKSFAGKELGVEKTSSQLNAMVGVDYLYRDLVFGLQVSDRMMPDWDGSFYDAERMPFATFSVKGDLFAARLDYRASTVVMFRNGDGGLSQALATFALTDRASVEAGVDILWGETQGLFGVYRNSDRVFGGFILHL